jgi:hypothetical protein
LAYVVLVTVALQHFEGKGLIDAQRGSIVIKDRDGLEEDANGLYGTPEAEFDRLFPRAKKEAFEVPRRLRGPRTKTKSQG